MSDLDALLAQARTADPSSRILLRDPIAAYGAEAIEPLAAWLVDERLGAFSVQVLRRIGLDSAVRAQVVAVLAAADRRPLAEPVARDVADARRALRELDHGPRAPREAGSARLPGDGSAQERSRRTLSTTEDRFHNAMLDIYWLAGRSTGYWANYFLRKVRAKGGIETARDLLSRYGTSPGFERLRAEHRLDLSMETLVIDPVYAALFTEAEIQTALDRWARRPGERLPHRLAARKAATLPRARALAASAGVSDSRGLLGTLDCHV